MVDIFHNVLANGSIVIEEVEKALQQLGDFTEETQVEIIKQIKAILRRKEMQIRGK